ncbi:U5 small nuclear ribonucleoprotein TSSC4 [Latimeria chalumnae]|uniref:U5 small nuclear ribonucleoprotein TSSC4 n=1 Tax=Latimeria chalumnae TaxID=7897 RepID=H3B4U0_LATCH|nr:PREDICTED: protein TSSC4 [Latimeria chalumnae]XP_005996132.1 PREDICTED: protein TSSC4 [Latimeria chalumnae]XP_005996133.1 PREDICTED: protein TSSC4 [Latimeria chalumnae]XP_005996134.1 PREDICTED: protein TSSC4 [Latimeria chalumnae]XP_005996135.1 PREDICTED: protein TSSC4 [Latimeria chalumnae]|eukprot:XP_005996131.1 PREDICTED: protein TSSC4 [Latimeria chalumnae]
MADKEGSGASTGIVSHKATDYELELPSDTASLSDSDPEDVDLLAEPEVSTISPEEPFLEPVDSFGGTQQCPRVGGQSPQQAFQLKGTTSSFSLRSQSIFEGLENPTRLSLPTLNNNSDEEEDVIDGPFKRPLPQPAPRRAAGDAAAGKRRIVGKKVSAVPDYVAHPERWTKYSLEDVEETSDRKNKMVALEFLEGLQKSREKKMSLDIDKSFVPCFNQGLSSSAEEKIVFSKPTKAPLEKEEARDVQHEDEAMVMKDSKPNRSHKALKKPSLKLEDPEKVELEHLAYEDEKEGEGGLPEVQDKKKPVEGSRKRSNTGQDKTLEEPGGFHNNRKINRKNIRAKGHQEEEAD